MDAPAAFMPALFIRRVDQEIREGLEQKRTESAALRIGGLEEISLHDHEEKILGQILRVGWGITAPENKGEDRAPIDLAELGEARIDVARGA